MVQIIILSKVANMSKNNHQIIISKVCLCHNTQQKKIKKINILHSAHISKRMIRIPHAPTAHSIQVYM